MIRLRKLRKIQPTQIIVYPAIFGNSHETGKPSKPAELGKPKKPRKLGKPGKRRQKRARESIDMHGQVLPAFKYVPPAEPSLRCVVCSQGVYWYERQEPAMCIWCEKLNDQNNKKVET